MQRLLLSAAVVLGGILASMTSHAQERLVDRPMTLHNGVLSLNPGVGIGHVTLPGPDANGIGLNLEAAYGITDRLEVGLRTGIRIGDDGKITNADSYGRTLWTETYGVNASTLANPEARIRWVAYSGDVAEVGLDGRIMLPVEHNSRFGMMFGVPLAFHVANFLRIDTGAYIPFQFYDHVHNGLSIPAYFWFQTSDKLWLGPMASLRFYDFGQDNHDAHILLGFGIGYAVRPWIDLKGQILFPAADNSLGDGFGVGFGAEFRIGQ